MSRKWYAVFSHTGKELENIQLRLGVNPNIIFTTNDNYSGPMRTVCCTKDLLEVFLTNVDPGSLITLHGYRYLLSEKAIKLFEEKNITVINIHPAPIYMKAYEELRGLDPHTKYYAGYVGNKYPVIGVTLHKVDAGVDTGEVVFTESTISTERLSYEEFTELLHQLGSIAWCKYLPLLLDREEDKDGEDC